MRRYRLGLDGREFVIDVQELGSDRFEVMVGEQTYQVALSGDEDMPDAVITPGMQTPGAGSAATRAAMAAAAAPRPARGGEAVAPPPARPAPAKSGGGGASLNAPMPGVILELHVQAGDVVVRGQQVAVLDAMKMHNFIGAPRAGTIAEVCVAAGQAVGHGDAIVRFAEG
jgi:biotin carboxyl carrier protein